MQKSHKIIIGIIVAAVVLGGAWFATSRKPAVVPTVSPTPEQAVIQLPPDQQPTVNLKFSADAHYVTVNIANLHANQLEYDLIYDATVKGQKLQTGVNAGADVVGKSTYTEKQLLGSESSGKFTYHTGIQNATLNLTLRDSSRRSIFTGTYPFTVKAGASADLTPSSE